MELNEVIGYNYSFAKLNQKRNIKFYLNILYFSGFYITWQSKYITWFYEYNLINNIIFLKHNLLNFKSPGTQNNYKIKFWPQFKTEENQNL